jgi:hypothetical protein
VEFIRLRDAVYHAVAIPAFLKPVELGKLDETVTVVGGRLRRVVAEQLRPVLDSTVAVVVEGEKRNMAVAVPLRSAYDRYFAFTSGHVGCTKGWAARTVTYPKAEDAMTIKRAAGVILHLSLSTASLP